MADAERQVAIEGAARLRVAVSAIAAGLVFFGGEVWITAIGAKEKSIGLLQGLAPAFNGKAAAAVDPRTIHERFLVTNETELILAFLLTGLGVVAMAVSLRYLANAERFRSPAPSPLPAQLALAGPILYGVFFPLYEISLIVGAHSYLSGSARTGAAITAANGGAFRITVQVILTLSTLVLAALFIMVSLRSMRLGLLTRMMGIVGIIGGVLFLIPLTPLPVIQCLWLVFFGAMLLGFGGRPLPEAWTSGEARPWPPREPAPGRQPRQSARGSRRGQPAPAPSVPEPAAPRGPSPSASKKRKRRR